MAHRVGPLFPANQEQAFDCRDRLFDLAVAADARGPRTRIDAVAFTADLTTRCRTHTLDPLPGYVHGPDARAVGISLIAHPHPDGVSGSKPATSTNSTPSWASWPVTAAPCT
ncbi:hypothetical protein [Embleya sp. NPDC005971]|uniref:hypothetical protein n=1 Tax=Embleya sp. NPDC005971 TaxID=3156724 RepID=UPI0033D80583